MFETVTSALIDVFPDKLTKRRTLVNILTGCMMFLIGIPFTCNVSQRSVFNVRMCQT